MMAECSPSPIWSVGAIWMSSNGKRYLDWDLPDPAGKGLDEVRPIRDQIDRRVRELLAELVPDLV
jgi:protein-tyrosine-phosphatase